MNWISVRSNDAASKNYTKEIAKGFAPARIYPVEGQVIRTEVSDEELHAPSECVAHNRDSVYYGFKNCIRAPVSLVSARSLG